METRFWPPTFNKKSGATVIGVRDFLIAYNINLNTTNVRIATDIAFEIREKGEVNVSPTQNLPFYSMGKLLEIKRERLSKKVAIQRCKSGRLVC